MYNPFAIVFALGAAGALCIPADAQTSLTLTDLGGVSAEFDLADLDAMPQAAFSTQTIWTTGEIGFSGVSLGHLLSVAGLEGETLRLIALNDYFVDIPLAEIEAEVPLVATRMEGEEMPVRNKGPFWVVYPYDASPEFQSETIFSRSVWHLSEIIVIE